MQGELSQIIFENLTLLVLALFLTDSLLSEIAWGGLHAFRLSHHVHFLTATGLGSTFGMLETFWPEVPNSSSFFPEVNPTASGNHVGQVYPSDRPTLQYQLSALVLFMCLCQLPEKQVGMQVSSHSPSWERCEGRCMRALVTSQK